MSRRKHKGGHQTDIPKRQCSRDVKKSGRGRGRGGKKGKDEGFETYCEDLSTMSRQLDAFGFLISEVIGDGNCLFRAFSRGYAGNEHCHRDYRQKCCSYMLEHEEKFDKFIFISSPSNAPSDSDFPSWPSFGAYVSNMSRDGEWGTHLELTALCEAYRVKAAVFRADANFFEIGGDEGGGDRSCVLISHHDETHFNAVSLKVGGKDHFLPPLKLVRAALGIKQVEELSRSVEGAEKAQEIEEESTPCERVSSLESTQAPSPPPEVKEEGGKLNKAERRRLKQKEKEMQALKKAEKRREMLAKQKAKGGREEDEESVEVRSPQVDVSAFKVIRM